MTNTSGCFITWNKRLLVMTSIGVSGGDESLGGMMKCWRRDGVEVSTTTASKDHDPCANILNKEAKRVKLDGTSTTRKQVDDLPVVHHVFGAPILLPMAHQKGLGH
jgi:hypothetical protein